MDEDFWKSVDPDSMSLYPKEVKSPNLNIVEKPLSNAQHNSLSNTNEEKPIVEKSRKVSTGCGPSPPKEIVATGSGSTNISRAASSSSINNISKPKKVSTGTSPPPQNISTQVLRFKIKYF